MYKAVVFFDLDQTLLNDDEQVPPENVAALKALQKPTRFCRSLRLAENYYELADTMAATGVRSAIAANGGDIFLDGDHHFSKCDWRAATHPFFSIRVQHKTIQGAMYNMRSIGADRP
ncbi:HAD family hydrolase [Lacticaseibacillus paracasei]